jgi:hypothetical protein
MITSHVARIGGLALSAGALSLVGACAPGAAAVPASPGAATAARVSASGSTGGATAAPAAAAPSGDANKVVLSGAEAGALSDLRMVCPGTGSSLHYELIATGLLHGDVVVVTLDTFGLSGGEQAVTVVRDPSLSDPFVPSPVGTLWQADTNHADFNGMTGQAQVRIPSSSAGRSAGALSVSLAATCPSAYQELEVQPFHFQLPLPGQIADATATVSTAHAGWLTGTDGKRAYLTGSVALTTPELAADTACDGGDSSVASLEVFSTDPTGVQFASGPVTYMHLQGEWVGYVPAQVSCGTTWTFAERLFTIAFDMTQALA